MGVPPGPAVQKVFKDAIAKRINCRVEASSISAIAPQAQSAATSFRKVDGGVADELLV